MAKIPIYTVLIVALFASALMVIYLPGIVIQKNTLEILSHIAGISGFLAILYAGWATWRKKLLNTGFTKFEENYKLFQESLRTEIDDFKADVRGFMKQINDRHEKHLDSMTNLFLDIQKEVKGRSRVCELVQDKKPILEAQEKKWKRDVKKELDDMDEKINDLGKKVSHIEDCVNSKKK